ncbi:iron complex transport system substrate-binding protein [Allopseudospirillum japonicum]|uniref:Iron complex transport system substrate-binding protein n=1 Tax=Allopseudospirillum japonicum TaxID=64971 RepID=A0A1H6TLC2_9GAMM|nr:ABC transporter substrate-binding protein [Allopseudospirillum japonicum]SEI80106.1 iron complex transport system substrate-binding protein [Allopseudospirillum japonicum]
MRISCLSQFSRPLLFASFLMGLPQLTFSQTPISLENCGTQINLKAPPERVVTVGQATTEMLYHLGLHTKVVGTSNWFTDVDPKFQEINAEITRLADNFPSFESLVSQKPDLVTADFLFSIGPQGVVGKREQFHTLGISTYVLASQCIDQDSSRGTDGTRTALFSLDNLYKNIRDLAYLFAVEEKGQALVKSIQAREAAVIAKSQRYKHQDVSAVFWYSSAALGVDPWVAGRKGVPGWMMSTLGINNIVTSDEVWPMVGWESIAKANPDIIVIARMDRRRFEADDYQKKLDFLRTDPVTKAMDAVINNRIVVMDAHAMDVTLRSIEGLETLSLAIDKMDFSGE